MWSPVHLGHKQMRSCWAFYVEADVGPASRETAPTVAQADDSHSTYAKTILLTEPGTFVFLQSLAQSWACISTVTRRGARVSAVGIHRNGELGWGVMAHG